MRLITLAMTLGDEIRAYGDAMEGSTVTSKVPGEFVFIKTNLT